MTKISRALLSVSDKTGIVEFARELNQMGVELLSTGGTAKLLKDADIPITRVSEYTAFPEMLDGRVKTLHPKIHAGLLAIRDEETHQNDLEKHNIPYIDMVVVNLYPFYQTLTKPDISRQQIIENIDIGGPTMLRSAAKNYKYVACVCKSARYQEVLDCMKANDGSLDEELLVSLAHDVFLLTSAYDSVIAHYFSTINEQKNGSFPETFSLPFQKIQDMRYGENPHQKAAFYKLTIDGNNDLTGAQQLQGKELSYNNLVDIDSAFRLVNEFTRPAAVIVKHNNPCGVAEADTILEAYINAYKTDSVSAFGGIMAFNKPIDGDLAREISSIFVEAIIAPDYTADALGVFASKKNLRLLKQATGKSIKSLQYPNDIKRVIGGVLIQNFDTKMISESDLTCVTKRKPTKEQIKSLLFSWKVAKHVKSNAIVLATGTETVGIGAGQMSRIDSSMLAAKKAQKPLKDVVMASDAFFPFRDNIDEAAKHGVAAIIEPGGSVRDQEVIDACNEHNIAMVFTGVRHFRH